MRKPICNLPAAAESIVKVAKLLIFCVAILSAMGAMADSFTFSGPPVTGITYGDTGIPIGPYAATLNSSPIDVYCVDPDHEAYWGTTWNVNVSSLLGNLSNTRLGTAGLQQYEEMAYLFFFDGYSTADAATQQAIQGAVWWIASSGASSLGANNSFVTAAAAAAAANFNGANFGNIQILSDSTGASQEFMTATPEPSTLLLFATGLIGVGSRLLKRRSSIS
jgi:hypothetical protein